MNDIKFTYIDNTEYRCLLIVKICDIKKIPAEVFSVTMDYENEAGELIDPKLYSVIFLHYGNDDDRSYYKSIEGKTHVVRFSGSWTDVNLKYEGPYLSIDCPDSYVLAGMPRFLDYFLMTGQINLSFFLTGNKISQHIHNLHHSIKGPFMSISTFLQRIDRAKGLKDVEKIVADSLESLCGDVPGKLGTTSREIIEDEKDAQGNVVRKSSRSLVEEFEKVVLEQCESESEKKEIENHLTWIKEFFGLIRPENYKFQILSGFLKICRESADTNSDQARKKLSKVLWEKRETVCNRLLVLVGKTEPKDDSLCGHLLGVVQFVDRKVGFSKHELFEPFAALDILLQGYLAIRQPEAIFGDNYEEFMKAHNILTDQGQKNNALKNTENSKLFRSFNVKEKKEPDGFESNQGSSSYWFDDCLPDIQKKSWNDLEEEYPELSSKDNLRKVWNIIRKKCLNKSDQPDLLDDGQWDQEIFNELFKEAHKEYMSLFGEANKNKRETELEEIRNTLNHNAIKNYFMYAIGSNQYSNLEERSKDMIAVWAYHSGQQGLEDIHDKLNNVNGALRQWGKSLRILREFFEQQIVEHGFVLTEKGELLKNELLDSDDSITKLITEFVDSFWDIGKLPKDDRLQWLEKFWRALDHLHSALSNMALRNEKNGMFGGYITHAFEKNGNAGH